MIYPPDIQDELNKNRDERDNVKSDKDESKGGWMNSEITSCIKEYSPKFFDLMCNILTRPDETHFIYTQFRYHYGLDFITTLLSYFNITYIEVTGSDKTMEQKKAKVDSFNSSNTTVLITTTKTLIDVTADNYHFMEGMSAESFAKIIYGLYKIPIRKTNLKPITTFFYVMQTLDGTLSSDGHFYVKMVEEYKERDDAFASRRSTAFELATTGYDFRIL
jgi:hypothetical protein